MVATKSVPVLANNQIVWFRNLGNGLFAPTYTVIPCTPPCVDPVAFDLEGDGYPDIGVTSGSTIVVLSYYPPTWIRSEIAPSFSGALVDYVFVDMNLDGFKECVCLVLSGMDVPYSLFVRKNVGIFWEQGKIYDITAISGSIASIGTFDMDSDGLMDIFVTNNIGQVQIFRNLGAFRLGPLNAVLATSSPFFVPIDVDSK